MNQLPYIFNQLLLYIPKDFFDRLVKKYKGDAYVKQFSCWAHLRTMIWAQFTSRRSLRDIEISLRAHQDKLYRLGIGKSISRNNIANANAKRDVAIYRELAQRMMLQASKIRVKDELLALMGKQFGIGGFFAIDSSTVSLDLSKFSWSVPQEGAGGLKLHTMFDLLRKVPRMCMITGHEERDQTFMEDYPYEKGCFYMLDRMYFKTNGLNCIESAGAYFITRIKRNVAYDTIKSNPIDGVVILEDKTIKFSSRWAKQGYPKSLRLISYYSQENNEVLKFTTNNFDLDAASIALLYRYRWEIEVFFKWIKQHLKINNFYGISGNAVMIQIYVAIISFCLLALAANANDFKGSLYDFSNIISVSLTEKILLPDLIKRVSGDAETFEQSSVLSLFDLDNLP